MVDLIVIQGFVKVSFLFDHALGERKEDDVSYIFYQHVVDLCLCSEKDAEMCYFLAVQTWGFCCDLVGYCSKKSAGVPGVLAVVQDTALRHLITVHNRYNLQVPLN
ncbi:hypothetical protein IGI04_012127 [Brassica rapa subsp. trilocularis]|uniref:MORF/ORRM1/DAG-like MORF domain-containing protein n=1 Tax=Brassica rapa subsp. trilocularis TaxID=1813537 RepID=A0ABQ7N523_BRACM|nr:hypothetical protein IGI04_012127 [Brassica rapa subsp. trilocularis]